MNYFCAEYLQLWAHSPPPVCFLLMSHPFSFLILNGVMINQS